MNVTSAIQSNLETNTILTPKDRTKPILVMTGKDELRKSGGFWSMEFPETEWEATLYCTKGDTNNGHFELEWDMPAIEEFITIGLDVEDNTLTDYDGQPEFPEVAKMVLESLKIHVPKEFYE